jgi:pyruvate formate lyase activating enzyme
MLPPFDLFKTAATLADLVLFDVKVMADPDHQDFTGKPVGQIIEFLIDQTPYRDVHILPFHTIGEGKYERLKINNTLKNISPPTGEHVEEVRQMFEAAGFNSIIGG